MVHNTKPIITERRRKLWGMLTKGIKSYEAAKQLGVDPSTITRDIKFLTQQSHTFLTDLAKETLPFMYSTSIQGIGDVLRESWKIYESDDESINWFQRLSALKLAKECCEAQFKLLSEGPAVSQLNVLQEKLAEIETQLQLQQQQQQPSSSSNNPITV